MDYVPARRLSLKSHPLYNEKWLQDRIERDPTMLNLGDLDVRDTERIQPHAGRLDLLLVDPVADIRYEVEIQLGATDPSHIIRTIEYWDIERNRYPKYKHVAVLVAEDITSRFLNVIRLFNSTIPIIAIQLNGFEVGEHFTISATTVLNLSALGSDEADEPGPSVDRAYWESRCSPASMSLLDKFYALVQDVMDDPALIMKYNKAYVGLARHGVADNFMWFNPRKGNWVLTSFRVPRTEELVSRLEEARFDIAMGYDPRSLHLRLTDSDIDRNRAVLVELIGAAADAPSVSDETVVPNVVG